MKRITPSDRDRGMRVLSVLTGSIAAGSLAAAGTFTVLADRETQRREALKVGAGTAGQNTPLGEDDDGEDLGEDGDGEDAPDESAPTTAPTGTHTYTTTPENSPSAPKKTTTPAKKTTAPTTKPVPRPTTSSPEPTPTTPKPVPTSAS